VLPVILVGLAITVRDRADQTAGCGTAGRQLKEARDLAQERERERGLAQDELLRRLYEERELNTEKT